MAELIASPTGSAEVRSVSSFPRSPLDELARVAKDLQSHGLPPGAGHARQPSLPPLQHDEDDFFGGVAHEDEFAHVLDRADEAAHQRIDSGTSNGHFSGPETNSNRASFRALPRLDTQGSLASAAAQSPARERAVSHHASKDSMHSTASRSNGGISHSAPPRTDFHGFEGDSPRSRPESMSAAPLERRSSFFEENGSHRRGVSLGRTDSASPDPATMWRRSAPAHRSYPSSLYGGSQPDLGVAPSLPRYDQSHLKPGNQAALLSSEKTLELYRVNVKKTNDPDVAYEFAVFLMEVARDQQGINGFSPAASSTSSETTPSLATLSSSEATNYASKRMTLTKRGGKERALDPLSATSSGPTSAVDDASRALGNAPHMLEAIQILRRFADRGHVGSQALLADSYARGFGTGPKCKPDYDKAFQLFVLAGKHGHPEACYRVGQCCENGWGCRKDLGKAVTWYNKAASTQHAASMYRLGIAGLNSELGLSRRQKEGFKWLKRAAELAHSQPEPATIQALHELAILHEKGVEHVVFVDYEYAAELMAKASELGYAPSAYKLGECYEYGKMGCPQDSALSIHYYNIAAQQGHREACFALTAWYLVGSPGVLPQSDTEAYLWAKRAAEQGLAKAEYAVGYFTESGMGRHKDAREAMAWFRRAADHGDKRAIARIKANAHQVAQMQKEEAAKQAAIRREAAQKEAAALRERQEREAIIARQKAERDAQLAREAAEREAKLAEQRERERRHQERQLAAFRSTPGVRQEQYYGGRTMPPPGLPKKQSSSNLRQKASASDLRSKASASDLRLSGKSSTSDLRLSSKSSSPNLRSQQSSSNLRAANKSSPDLRLPPGAGPGEPRARAMSAIKAPAPPSHMPLTRDQTNNKDDCVIA